MKQRLLIALMMVLGVILSILGCGGGNPYSPKLTVTGANFPLNISAPQTVAPGGTVTYTIFGNQLNQAGQNQAQTRAADDIELSVTGGRSYGRYGVHLAIHDFTHRTGHPHRQHGIDNSWKLQYPGHRDAKREEQVGFRRSYGDSSGRYLLAHGKLAADCSRWRIHDIPNLD